LFSKAITARKITMAMAAIDDMARSGSRVGGL
jgi:hypothetical protein